MAGSSSPLPCRMTSSLQVPTYLTLGKVPVDTKNQGGVRMHLSDIIGALKPNQTFKAQPTVQYSDLSATVLRYQWRTVGVKGE